MDPLSITAATIGITSFALSSIKQLRDNIDDVAEAKEVLEDISTDLTGILAPLDSLRVLLHASRTDHAIVSSSSIGLMRMLTHTQNGPAPFGAVVQC